MICCGGRRERGGGRIMLEVCFFYGSVGLIWFDLVWFCGC